MTNTDAYGLPVWAIILIGLGFATMCTIFFSILSTCLRRRLIKSHRHMTFTVYPAVPRTPSKAAPPHAHGSVILDDAAIQNAQHAPSTDSVVRAEQNGSNAYTVENRGVREDNGDVLRMQTFSESTSMPMLANRVNSRMSLDSSVSEPPAPRQRPMMPPPKFDFNHRRFERISEGPVMLSSPGSPPSSSMQPLMPTYSHVDVAKKRKKRTGSPISTPTSRPLSRTSMSEIAANDQELDEEFRSLPSVKVDSKMLPPDAYVKNRYSSVLPAPDSLVPVHSEGTGSGYINANFVRGYEGRPKAYIATQAPMENTVDDFWSMVMEQNVSVIIMVTYLYEYGVEKCIQYWPERGTTRYGSTEVANLEEVHKEHYVRTTLRLRHVTMKTVKTVRHYAFTAWPEHGMPRSSIPIRSFLRDISTGQSQGPVVVHCSAGVGRTGVVIAIDIGMTTIETTGVIDVVGIVSMMRQDRPGAVQTRSQYRFVYKALKDHMQEEKAAVV